ncbi:hypothetical protein [Defluviitalea phaphyphila]|uniref:hypothetical protein n=1 Tax=Defluviitalea phaphyphila TaxID=1473580 RepID=UPI0013BE901F|nr:hypothetical protein [Defluviitalea phaphyphila]
MKCPTCGNEVDIKINSRCPRCNTIVNYPYKKCEDCKGCSFFKKCPKDNLKSK